MSRDGDVPIGLQCPSSRPPLRNRVPQSSAASAAFSVCFPLFKIEPQYMRTCLAPFKGEINHEASGLHKPQVTSFSVFNCISGRALSGGRESLCYGTVRFRAPANASSDCPIHPRNPCHLWTVDADDIPFFDARWVIGAGNSVQVRGSRGTSPALRCLRFPIQPAP
jgi:hypothetical protein